MNELRLLRQTHTLRFLADAVLPPFIGNTLRGALGHALHDMNSPAYARLFKVAGADSRPNPYALSAPYPAKARYARGDTLLFTITLFGAGCAFAPEVAAAVRQMCKGKLAVCELADSQQVYDRVWRDSGAEGIPPTGRIRIEFLSPTELLSAKEPVRTLDFSTFIDSLFGRICGIIDRYTDGEFVLPYALVARRPLVTAAYDLKPVVFQTSGQPIYGVMGQVTYSGDVTRFLPYIDLGSQIHIGKKTTRACGAYRFEPEDYPLTPPFPG